MGTRPPRPHQRRCNPLAIRPPRCPHGRPVVEVDPEAHDLDSRIAAFFGGHIHLDAELDGPLGLPVVLTAAAKDDTPPRFVGVSEQGALDW